MAEIPGGNVIGPVIESALERGYFDLYLLRARKYIESGTWVLRGFKLLNLDCDNKDVAIDGRSLEDPIQQEFYA